MKILTSLLAIVFFVTALGCGKPCVEAQYQFSMQESFSPDRDSILVGDTIFMLSSHSTSFRDNSINDLIDFSGSQIGANLRVLSMPTNTNVVIGAMNDFAFLIYQGKTTGNDNLPSENKGLLLEENSSNYELNIGLIAKQKGTYLVSLGNSGGIIKKNHGCEKADIEIDNSNVNNHLYFYENFFSGLPLSDYTKTHIYCFKVY
ncbi:MAG TPA: hypothetical protein VGI82_06905 [Chitinophagaceae bacterium]|jgi:hypothetical protein